MEVARLNTKLVAGLHDHIVMRGAAPSLRSLNSLISTSSDCPHARLPPSSPSPLHNKFLIGAPSTTTPRPQYSETLYPKTSFVQLNSTSSLFLVLSAACSFHHCCCCQLGSKPVFTHECLSKIELVTLK